MAPVLVRDVTRRDSNTGKTSSVIFVVIAFLVVVACILWGYFIPKWRRKYGRPSSTRFNCIGDAAKYSPSIPPKAPRYVPRVPSHPGVRRLHTESSLPTYDPQTETPFWNSPRAGEISNLCRLAIAPTPDTQGKISLTRKRPTHDYELPKTPGTLSQLALTNSLGDCSLEEVEESEPQKLMIPLTARLAGRAPPLTKQLALFPAPTSNSVKRFDTLAHPNLLFEKIDKHDPLKLLLSSDAPGSSGSTLGPTKQTYADSRRNTIIQNVEDVRSVTAGIREAVVVDGLLRESRHTKDLIAPPVAVRKSNHKYKPKKPVASIRHTYDRYTGGMKFVSPRNASIRRHLTPSTERLTTSTSAGSDYVNLTTPPTSPTPSQKDISLLPPPLRLRHAVARLAPVSPTPGQASERRMASSESSEALSPSKLTPFSMQRSLKSRRDFRKSIGFYHPKPILGSAIGRSKPGHVKKSSWKSSGVYSRDTKDISMLPKPKSAVNSNEESRNSPVHGGPSSRRTSSIDLVRSKIDDSNLPIADLPPRIELAAHWPQSKVGHRSPPLRIGMSNPAQLASCTQAEACTTFGLTMPIRKNSIGRSSDDVFGDGGSAQRSVRVLGRVLDVEIASTGSRTAKYCGWTAPGGAEWI